MERLMTTTLNYIALHEAEHLLFGIQEMLKAGLDDNTIKKGTVLILKEDNPDGTEHGSFVIFDRENKKLLSGITHLAGGIGALSYLGLIDKESLLSMRKDDIINLLKRVGGADDVERGKIRYLRENELKDLVKEIINTTEQHSTVITRIASDVLRTGKLCGGGLNYIIQALKKKN